MDDGGTGGVKMDEVLISKAIVEAYTRDLLSNLDVDVAIAGAGPSGLICGYYLAKGGAKVAIFERQLKLGGGMPGGGMMFNKIVFQEEAKKIIEEFDVRLKKYEGGLYIADSIETILSLALKAIKMGVKVFNLINVEDLVIRENRVAGLVLNWSAVSIAELHVDPLAVRSKFVLDATGHDAEVCKILERKLGPVLNTKTGRVIGEQSMWSEVGESQIIENSKEVYPGLYVCGMAANAVYGSPRMGAIFGGMLLSGKKVAEDMMKNLRERR